MSSTSERPDELRDNDLVFAWQNMVARVHASLECVPAELADEIAAEADPDKIASVLEKAIAPALRAVDDFAKGRNDSQSAIEEVRALENRVVEIAARSTWNSYPHLALVFADFGDFLQSHLVTQNRPTGRRLSDVLLQLDVSARAQGTVALARQQLSRKPLAGGAALPIADRRGGRLVLWLYGSVVQHADIHGSIDEARVCRALAEHADADAIILRIDSPGGTAEVAQNISHALLQHKARKVAIIDRQCCSAAVFFAAASDRVIMRENATLMIHQVKRSAFGNSSDFRALASEMHAQDEAVVRLLAAARGIPVPVLRDLIKQERYLTAAEAMDLGFADDLTRPLP